MNVTPHYSFPMPHLTRRESALHQAIADHVHRTGFSPSREELRAAMGWKSSSTVQYFINRLRAKGVIETVEGSTRNIRLANAQQRSSAIPVIGRVAADVPLLSDKHIEATVPAAAVSALFRSRPDYFLRVQGESMSGAGIRQGDLVAVREASDARNGDIVVVCVDGKATLKRLHRNNESRALVSENPNDLPDSICGERCQIHGIVIGTLSEHPST